VVDITLGRYAIVGALLAWLLVLRPLMRMLTQRGRRQAGRQRLPGPAAGGGAAAAPAGRVAGAGAHGRALPEARQRTAMPRARLRWAASMPVQPLLENYDLPPAGSAVDVMVDHLKVLAGKEPERVAEVVKQWVQKKNGGSEQ
jgi:flagellar M-ring protein FliF